MKTLALMLQWLLIVFPACAQEVELETVREQLVYPKPLMLTISNPLPITEENAGLIAVVRFLESRDLFRVEESKNELLLSATSRGQEHATSILNLANYKVTGWKLRLGMQDIEQRSLEKRPGKSIISGRRIIVGKDPLYDSVFALLGHKDKRLIENLHAWTVENQEVEESCAP